MRETDILIIRGAIPEDAVAVSQINIQAWQEFYQGILVEEDIKSLSLDEMTRDRQHSYTNIKKGCAYLVALMEGKIVGFCEGGAYKNEEHPRINGKIYTLYVLKAYQNLGVGKQLFQKTLDILKREGIARIIVSVFEKNYKAQAFYEHIGGTCMGRGVYEGLSRPYPVLYYLF